MTGCSGETCCCRTQDESVVKEVQAALDTWLNAVSTGSPDAVMTLYKDHAVLLPTLAPGVHDTREKRLGYFTAFTANENLRGKVNELHTRVFGDVAVNSGLYTFTFKKDGKEVTTPARFSFVYKKTPMGWMIVDHHSSVVPAGH